MAAEKKERRGTNFRGLGQDSGRDYRGKDKNNASSQSVEDSLTCIIGIQSKFKLSFFFDPTYSSPWDYLSGPLKYKR
jgi:hypothetical protein